MNAAKKFKASVHSKKLLQEDQKYLTALNQHIDKQIYYHFHPSKIQVKELNKKVNNDTDSFATS